MQSHRALAASLAAPLAASEHRHCKPDKGTSVVPKALYVEEYEYLCQFNVKHQRFRPLHIYLALDNSGSMSGSPINDAKAAITSFIDAAPREELASWCAPIRLPHY